jgi:hypothetical protein
MNFQALTPKLLASGVIVVLLAGCVVPATPAPPTAMPAPAATAAPAATEAGPPPPEIKPSSNVSVYATGLDSPRGLKFGPDGALYIAEGGKGGTTSTTAADCEQVPPPVGPYSGGMTARISKIGTDGTLTTVAENLASSQTSPDMGSLVSGVADIAFVGDTLYALITEAGCSHGLKDTSNAVVKINADGTLTQIADLSAFYQTHPTKNINKDDFEPDGTPYSMMEMDGNLYVVEPNHGSLEKVTPDGEISRVLDISEVAGHIVPTGMAYHDNFFVGNLSIFPVPANAAVIMEITPEGQVKRTIPGLTAVVGVAFDSQGRLYALETTTVGGQLPVPGSGKVVRIEPDSGNMEEIATGLALPSAMTFGPDGMLYVSNYGYGFPPGSGQIVKIEVP